MRHHKQNISHSCSCSVAWPPRICFFTVAQMRSSRTIYLDRNVLHAVRSFRCGAAAFYAVNYEAYFSNDQLVVGSRAAPAVSF